MASISHDAYCRTPLSGFLLNTRGFHFRFRCRCSVLMPDRYMLLRLERRIG